MRKRIDENLNLEQLLARCKELDPETQIRIYFDRGVCWFCIGYVAELDFFLPPAASFICECRADGVRLEIEIWIANALRTLMILPKK